MVGPRPDDVVLGGQFTTPLDAAVLGGIEGLRLHFKTTSNTEIKKMILKQALPYQQKGIDWLFEVLEAETIGKDKVWIYSLLANQMDQKIQTRLTNSIKFSLSGMNLSRLDLVEVNLSGANLSNTNLHEAKLISANLSGANLFQANLQRANLIGANLSKTDLRKANLMGANLFQADLNGANLMDANLHQIYPNYTNLLEQIIEIKR
ncbi:MAG: pentapeptide repeat-containing protein [Microcystaceae cyanobacterium]